MKKIKDMCLTMYKATKYSFAYAWRNAKFDTIATIVMQILTGVLAYLIVYATGIVINGVQNLVTSPASRGMTLGDIFTGELRQPLLIFAGVLVASLVINRLNWFFSGRWSQWLRSANKLELYAHRSTLDVAVFKSKTYDDLRRQIEELPYGWYTPVSFVRELMQILSAVISFALFGATLFFQEWRYAVIILVSAIPIVVSEAKQVNLWWKVYENMVPNSKKRGMLERVYHGITGFTQALMFHQTPSLNKEIKKSYKDDFDAWEYARRIGVKREFISYIISLSGLYFVIVHAVWNTISLGTAIGTLTILIASARTMQSSIDQIVNMVAEQWNTAKGMILIREKFFALQPLIQTPLPIVPSFESAPLITFDHVSFKYPEQPDKEVLTNVSFKIEPGSVVAIVGKSGHGKSTIASLLMRHYDPTSGDIFANEINLKHITPVEWSKYAAALTQKFVVLERKVAEEIASSQLEQELNMQKVIDSAKFSVFDEVVEKDEKGYDTQIGTDFGGREFSGGEEQRLALARLHYRNTPIVILDEPDAKLDPENASVVIKNVLDLKKRGITVVLITHHVSRAEKCDKIIVMQKGVVAEQGTHTELMAKNSVYASMYNKDKERLGVIDWEEEN